MPVTRLAFLGFTQGMLWETDMVDRDHKILGKYFASLAAPIEYLGLDIDVKFKLLLKRKAEFISLIIKELLEQEKGISKKHDVPYPKHIEELNGEERHKFFEKLIFDQEFPDTPTKILEQLSAIHMFYFVFSKIEMKPSSILLMAVDNLAMPAIYACGLSAKNPALFDEHFRIEKSKERSVEKALKSKQPVLEAYYRVTGRQELKTNKIVTEIHDRLPFKKDKKGKELEQKIRSKSSIRRDLEAEGLI